MIYSTELLQDQVEFVYPSIESLGSWYCHEETSSRSLYMLSTAKRCGLLLLINKLLTQQSNEEKEASQKHRNYTLAAKLIHNFYQTTITISNPQSDDVMVFISQTLDEAKRIANTINESNAIVYIYAKRLANAFEICHSIYDDIIGGILERTWEDFAIHYLQEKLHRQMYKE